MAGSNLDAIVAQALHRIGGSFDGVAAVLRRDSDAISGRLRRGTDTVVNRDRLNRPDVTVGGVGPQDYVGKPIEQWIRPPVVRIAGAPELIADTMESIHRSGARARWANYTPSLFQDGLRGLENWLRSDGKQPIGELNERYGLNCTEMIGYAAAKAGVVSQRFLRRLLLVPRNADGSCNGNFLDTAWSERMGDWMIPEGRRVYTGAADSPRPQRGDIVMWNNTAHHVAMATGRTGKDGSPELYSFWYLPKYQLTHDPETGTYSQVVDAVQVTTVRELTDGMLAMRDPTGEPIYDPGTVFQILFGRGPW
ncbi:MAG: hypothetical protein HOQ44_14625 [Nocardia sp.]|nr:hypothetical protein [Nocardia sp.]